MSSKVDLGKFQNSAKLKDRYAKQLQRLQAKNIATACIEEAVEGAIVNLATAKNSSLVIYGEPQSGKTEMMICLTAKLLDDGHQTIVHLMNDSVDLLTQNLRRFRSSGLAPAPKSLSEVLQSSSNDAPGGLVVFCKKNPKDLDKLGGWLENKTKVVVIDDEADFASPNFKINQGDRTTINKLVGELIDIDGYYVGVTATPARLDLNNTFGNDVEKWVNFPPHPAYTGQDIFFPLNQDHLSYRRTLLKDGGSPAEAQRALLRFMVSVAYLNCYENGTEDNYTTLVHTSGKKQDHEADRAAIEQLIHALTDSDSEQFESLVTELHQESLNLYPNADPDSLTEYVVANASRATLVVLNSERDRKALGDNATEPSSPFTVIIGGNIVSRGVTFPNLLAMFFTRDVKQKLQQDTYIQRARMFGARGKYLQHFELSIPSQLYADWHKCFVFHKLALATIKSGLGSPVWIGDGRVAVAAGSSINKATVAIDKGEMSFGMFDFLPELDDIVEANQTSVETLEKIRDRVGEVALPRFVIDYIKTISNDPKQSLVIHKAYSIAGSSDADQESISRQKGFMGRSQLEKKKFPDATHHFKIFYNAAGRAKMFLKFRGVQFTENLNVPVFEPES